MRTHGMEGTRPYRIWRGIKTRCLNSGTPLYKQYGARGITICDRWKDSFSLFWEDMKSTYREDLEIERRNNDGDYCPENCCWETHKNQCNNRRSSRYITAQGKTLTLGKWSEETGLKLGTIWMRLKRGATPEDAVSISIHKLDKRRNKYFTALGQTKRLLDWASETGITYRTLRTRIKQGWNADEVVSISYPATRSSRHAKIRN
jgi:hypothetical protein